MVYNKLVIEWWRRGQKAQIFRAPQLKIFYTLYVIILLTLNIGFKVILRRFGGYALDRIAFLWGRPHILDEVGLFPKIGVFI